MNQEQSPIANREVSGNRERQRKNARDNLIHAGEFTKIENTAIVYVLRGWFGALIRPENATEIVQASDDVWAAQTLFEHFDSELNSDSTTRTRESRRVLAELKARAEAAQEQLKPTFRRRHRRRRTYKPTHRQGSKRSPEKTRPVTNAPAKIDGASI